MEVERGAIVVFADIACPWAHVGVHRLHEARDEAGLAEDVRFDIRAFPLELLNQAPTSRRHLDAEIPVAGALAPGAGWSVWHKDASTYPVTMIPAMEAVYAAKDQSLLLSDRLDRALRRAFFRDARCISMHHEILAVAEEVEGLDLERLERDLVAGTFRRKIFEDKSFAEENGVQGSPHLFFPDGSDVHNPGVKIHSEGGKRGGFPVVDEDDPAIYGTFMARVQNTRGSTSEGSRNDG